MILIHPPVAKPCEPPAGCAKLSGTLSLYSVDHYLLDANLEGIMHLLRSGPLGQDTWTIRAGKGLIRNILALKGPGLYRNVDRYRRAVLDVNRVLQQSSGPDGPRITLADYQDKNLSPQKSLDLLHAADHPEENPFYPYFRERLTDLLEKDGSGVVGFSVNYLSQALCAFAMMGFLRKRFPSAVIVAGGGLITSWMRNSRWPDPFGGLIDHLVSGPGEIPLLRLSGKDVSHPPYDGRPSFDGLPIDDYLAPAPIFPYSASTGCYWAGCSFCPERAEGNPFSQRPYDRITDDLSLLARNHRGLIHFTDNAVSPGVLKRLGQTPPGLPWYGFARITDHLADPGFCRALKSAGCVMLKVGLESGDQDVLDAMRKGNRVSLSGAVLRTLKEAGIATYVYLLFGTPSETLVSARKTLDFTAGNSAYIDFLNVAVFNLPLDSPDAASLETAGFYEGDLSLYADFRHPLGWDRKKVRAFLDGEFRKHPAIRPILHRHPPLFTSNHAPFLV